LQVTGKLVASYREVSCKLQRS